MERQMPRAPPKGRGTLWHVRAAGNTVPALHKDGAGV
jgi:hypothetical protein